MLSVRNMNGQSLAKAFILLPGQATAVYTSNGLDRYRHSDWLGSARLTSSPSRAFLPSTAYAPFGETYAQAGASDLSFTGQNSDTTSGDYDFLSREYSIQGRLLGLSSQTLWVTSPGLAVVLAIVAWCIGRGVKAKTQRQRLQEADCRQLGPSWSVGIPTFLFSRIRLPKRHPSEGRDLR